MTMITPDWLREQLSAERGLQSRLAEYLGLSADKMSKTVKGERRIQAAEAVKIAEFFSVSDRSDLEALREAASGLSDDRLQQVLEFVQFQKDQQAAEDNSKQGGDAPD